MNSRNLKWKIAGSTALITLFAFVSAFLLITGVSLFLSFVCLIVILLITLFIIRLTSDVNNRIDGFFKALHNQDASFHCPVECSDPSLSDLYREMNRITKLFAANRNEVEEKCLYYESILNVLTHEIRNSLVPITSLSSDLLKYKDTYEPAQFNEGLEVINQQSANLYSFLDAYHRLTHLPDPNRQSVQMKSLFQKLERLLYADPKRHCVHFSTSDDLVLHVDPNLLTLALINLIRNALQSVAEESSACIHIEAFDRCITITDNGPGIPPELLSAVFTPFFSTKNGGSGIGLSLSQRIMHLHGGELRVSSLPNVKTVFTMTF